MEQKYIDRFWGKVDIKGKDDCWNWTAGKKSGGYGAYYCGYMEEAHRFSYMLAFGGIPNGLCVCHACDNTLCCNPNHLWAGTRNANNLDRDRKGRQIAHLGEKHGMAKLKDEQVLKIRELYKTGSYTYQQLSELFNVGITMVGYIVSGSHWKHLPNQNNEYRQGKKLDRQTASMIRELYDTGKYSHQQLGDKFGVSKTMAGLIIRGRFWK